MSLHSLAVVTKYMLPCCRSSYVWYVEQKSVPSTALRRCSNRLVLLDSEHQLQILQQL